MLVQPSIILIMITVMCGGGCAFCYSCSDRSVVT